MDSIEVGDGKPAKRELDMAKTLIDSLSSGFEADKYRDEYREELLSLLERKAKGEEVVSATTEAPTPTKAPDLMAALEESLAAVKGEEERATEPKPKPKPRSKKTAGTTKSRSRSKAKAAK